MSRVHRNRSARAVGALHAWGLLHAQCALSSLGALWRAPAGTALTAAVIGIALAMPACAYVAMEKLLVVSAHFSHTADMSIFLRIEVDDTRAFELAHELAASEGVAEVRVITKEQALEEFRAAAGVGYGLENLGDDNPLPAVLALTPSSQSAQEVEALRTRLAMLPEVDFVQADGEWLLRLEAIVEVLRRSLWVLAGLLAAGIVLVVGNTLRLSIEARRAEVEVAKLFGASDGFVRRPFLYHGLFYGLLGAFVSCLLLQAARMLMAPAMQRLADVYSGDVVGRELGTFGFLLLLLVLAGGWLGLLGAWLCVGHHLRRVEPR